MDFNQLNYFLTVVKYKHFTLASEELCISQSSLSKHIKALESELGIQLLDRSTRNLQLTPFGEEFLTFCQRAIDDYTLLNCKLKKYSELEKQNIKIGAVPVMNQHGVTALIASFQKSFPLIHIEIIQKKTKELISLLKNGELDVAFFVTDSVTEIGFDTYPVMHDELVLVTHKNHPLVNHKTISFSEISKESFIFFDFSSGMHEISMAACKQAGFTPNILHECTQIDTILELVSEGIGVSLLMDKVVSYFNNPRIKILHFNNPIIGTTVLAIPSNKKISQSITTFREFSLNWIKNTL
jgi:DNA-binding transcriptional LysR family regulator